MNHDHFLHSPDEEVIERQSLARQYGVPTSKQMEMINRLARIPLEPEQVFVFNAKLVGDMVIPNRYMQIHKSLLNVFKEDAKTGVALMLDHSWANFFGGQLALVYGRTFDAQLRKSDTEGEQWALYADHYLVRGKEKDGISTDALIADLSDGTAFDTSIGWMSSNYECSICGNDYRDYSKCEHFAGREYDGELCYVIAKPPGNLLENSIVFDGAYPTAGVLSQVERLSETPMVAIDDFKGLEPGITLFHTYSATKGKLLTFAKRGEVEVKGYVKGVTLSKGGDNLSDKEKLEKDLEQEAQEEIREAESIEVYLTRDEATELLGQEIEPEQLLIYAQEGMKYLNELKEDAEKWGVRAQGDKFNKRAWKTRFELMSAEEMKNIIETFKAEAESAIPAGRQTDPEAEKQGDNEPADDYPDEAFEM